MTIPLVSIIVASFNKAELIGQTISSVLQQSEPNWQLLVVDDCSTDHTLQVLQQFSGDERITVESLDRNRGANYCRNRGIELAKGTYSIFIDADDLFADNCLKGRLGYALSDPVTDLFVFSMGVFYRQPGDASYVWQPVSKHPLRDFLQHLLPWTIVQPLWKTETLKRLGGFDLSFHRLQDVELHTRALLDPDLKFRLVGGEPDCFYRIDEERRNFDSFTFLTRWVDAAVMYCDKFRDRVPSRLRQYLAGTLCQSWLQCLYRHKKKEITDGQLQALEGKLVKDNSAAFRSVFRILRIYNLHLPRVPGINRMLHKLAIRFYT